MVVAPRWTGLEAAALRQAHRMSIRAYAAHLGVAIATVANWDSRGAQARLRTETQQMLDIELARASVDVRERFEAILAPTPKPIEPHSPLGPAEVFISRGIVGDEGADSDDAVVTKAMRAFRIADSQLGGAPLYSVVVAYLRSHIGPRLFDGIGNFSTPAAFNAAASMLEMAGWMAHDCGDNLTAEAHFGRALAFTTVGDDIHLRSHVLGSMSHLAAHMGRPHETIRLAQRGQAVLRDAPPHSPLTARLLALEARGTAALGEPSRPRDLLTQAESELAKGEPRGQTPSPWLSDYDQASLASDATRCLRQLGDLDETRRQAERIVALRPAHRTRSRGLAQLTLANVLVAQEAIDEASAVAAQALGSRLPLQSAPITRGLYALHDALAPHQNNATVAEIRARITTMLQQGGGPSRPQSPAKHRT